VKVWLDTASGRRKIVEVTHTSAIAVGECPSCGASPLRVCGRARTIEGHDVYAARAMCGACDDEIGTIRARVSTLFGLREDEAVLVHGRARVY